MEDPGHLGKVQIGSGDWVEAVAAALPVGVDADSDAEVVAVVDGGSWGEACHDDVVGGQFGDVDVGGVEYEKMVVVVGDGELTIPEQP